MSSTTWTWNDGSSTSASPYEWNTASWWTGDVVPGNLFQPDVVFNGVGMTGGGSGSYFVSVASMGSATLNSLTIDDTNATIECPVYLATNYDISIEAGTLAYDGSAVGSGLTVGGSLTVGGNGTTALLVGSGDNTQDGAGVVEVASNITVGSGGVIEALAATDSILELYTGGGTIQTTGGGELQIAANSALELDSNTTGTVVFNNASTGSLMDNLAAGGGSGISVTIQGMDTGSSQSIVVVGADVAGTATISGGQATITSSASGTDTFTFGSSYNGDSLVGTYDGTNTTFTLVCFAAGTQIQTRDGHSRVESLKPGDMVAVVRDGAIHHEPVKWLGHRSINLSAHPRREQAAPVRIKRGAFADAVPSRDLLVSPEHAIHMDGKLVQAAQLVNGATILRDTAMRAVTYYHVELERHGLLLAEGLETESYLDCGNRDWFANSGVSSLNQDYLANVDETARFASSCAPFVADATLTEPLWRRLADRAVAMGLTVPALLPEGPTTTDADLHVMVGNKRIDAVSRQNGRHVFMLPAADTVRLVSRSVALADRTPWAAEQRRLGVWVNRVTLRHATADVETIAMDSPSFGLGWSFVEQPVGGARRWTDGDATLRLNSDTPVVLEVEAAAARYYPLDAAETTRAAA